MDPVKARIEGNIRGFRDVYDGVADGKMRRANSTEADVLWIISAQINALGTTLNKIGSVLEEVRDGSVHKKA